MAFLLSDSAIDTPHIAIHKVARRATVPASMRHTTTDLRVEELSWDAVRDQVSKINPDLFAAIEAISPNQRQTFIKCDYHYGDPVFEKGMLHLPSNKQSAVRLDDPQLPTWLRNKLDYAALPLGLQLSGKSEAFFSSQAQHTIPLHITETGALLGAPEVLAGATQSFVSPAWDVAAGTRTVFMLPKIADIVRHKRLTSSLGIDCLPPVNLSDHWSVFKAIAAASQPAKPSHYSVLFFSKDWFDHQAKGLFPFQQYMLSNAWRQSRHHHKHHALWEQLATTIQQRRLKPSPYLFDTVKHLWAIACGDMPAFRPAEADDVGLPLAMIEAAYLDAYGIDHAPTIMCPTYFRHSDAALPLYYSLAHPTLLGGSALMAQRTSLMSELRECQRLVGLLETTVAAMADGPDAAAIPAVDFRYFHSGGEAVAGVHPSAAMVEGDSVIENSLQDRFAGKAFSEHARFAKGCIRIARASDHDT